MRRITPPAAGSRLPARVHSGYTKEGTRAEMARPGFAKRSVAPSDDFQPHLLGKRGPRLSADLANDCVHSHDGDARGSHPGDDSSELPDASATGADVYPELPPAALDPCENRTGLDDENDDAPPLVGIESMKLNQSSRLRPLLYHEDGAPALHPSPIVEARQIASHLWHFNAGWVFMQYCVRRLHSRRWQLCVAAMLSAPVLAAMLVISPLWAVWIWSTDDVEFAHAFWWALGRISWGRLSLPPTIDTHGASTSVPKPVVLRMASPHLVVLLTVVDCATVRQSCSCGALFATRQQPAVGSVHRDRLADSAGARCDRWPRNYHRKLSSGSARPRLGSARPYPRISHISRTLRQLPPQHSDASWSVRCAAGGHAMPTGCQRSRARRAGDRFVEVRDIVTTCGE